MSSVSSSSSQGMDALFPGVLPAVPADAMPVIPDKDRRSQAATAASAAGVRALSAQALQFYFRAPVKAFFRTRVDYLAYARGPDGSFSGGSGSGSGSGSSGTSPYPPHHPYSRLRRWFRGTTPGVLTQAIRRYGWSVVPEQVIPPLLANIGVAAVLYTSYLQILGHLHPESGQARRRVYPPPAPLETFTAGFLAGSIQSVVAAPLDAIQARYDHGAAPVPAAGGSASSHPQSMWAFSAAKLREIGLRGIFAGWGLSFLKDSCGSGIFFSVFEGVKAQAYYRFVAYYYGAMDDSIVLERHLQEAARDGKKQHRHHLHHHHKDSPDPAPSMPLVIRPHYAIEPAFLLLAGISASFAQQVLLHPLTHIQVLHWDLLEDLDDAAKAEAKTAARIRAAAAAGAADHPAAVQRRPFHLMRTYYHAYQETWRRCCAEAAAEGRSAGAWLYRGFWWNTIRQVPSTSAGLIIFELVRRKYGLAGDEVRIRQDGYDILLA